MNQVSDSKNPINENLKIRLFVDVTGHMPYVINNNSWQKEYRAFQQEDIFWNVLDGTPHMYVFEAYILS